MGEDRFACAVSFIDDGFSQIQGHDEDAIGLDRTGENLDAVRAVTNLLAHSLDTLSRRFDIGNFDLIRFDESLCVNRRSTFSPEWLASGENARPFNFAGFDTVADEIGVFEDGSNIKNAGESPASEHGFELGGELRR